MSNMDIFGAEGDNEFLSRQAPEDFGFIEPVNGIQKPVLQNGDLNHVHDKKDPFDEAEDDVLSSKSSNSPNLAKAAETPAMNGVLSAVEPANPKTSAAFKESQQQMQKVIEARLKEEEALKKEQREIAADEIKAFYAGRKKNIQRLKQTQNTTTKSGKFATFEEASNAPWTRILSIVESSIHPSEKETVVPSTPSNTPVLHESQKMKHLLMELSAEETKTTA